VCVCLCACIAVVVLVNSVFIQIERGEEIVAKTASREGGFGFWV